jgi:hypothetical protein
MKVLNYSAAALAAIVLASQGVAQQSEESLERALADLNNGLAAPAGNGNVTIDGDFRARNRWYDDGSDTNNRDIDTRARLNFFFNINENATAFVGFSGREAFGGSYAGRWDMGDIGSSSGEGLDRAWVSVDNLVGDGGNVTIGRRYWTAGSGRMLGSEEWDNYVTTFSGIWYNHAAGGFNIQGAMINGVENGPSATDDMIYFLSGTWVCDMIEACGPIALTPWFLRDEAASAGPGGDHETWIGAMIGGEVMGVGYDAEIVRYEWGDSTGNAWYIGGEIQLDALESVPGIEGGGLNIALSQTDDEFAVPGVNSAGTAYGLHYHDAVGFADVLGTSGIWSTDTDTWRLGVDISPAEGWMGGLAYMNIDMAGSEYDEIDLSVGTQLNGGVDAWFGYALIDPSASGADNMSVFWAVLDLAFGG